MSAPTAGRVAAAVAVAGAAGLAYSAGYEVRAFRLRRVTVPVLPPGERPLRVLHFSDAHLTPGQRRKREWMRRLAALEPDLVVNTGDSIAHPDAVPALLDALEPLLERPGVFVFGSNDYYAPKPKNPARYLMRDTGRRIKGTELPWRDLRDGFQAAGWVDLSNARATLEVDRRTLAFAGVDDPHLRRDRCDDVAGPAEPGVTLAIGVTHSPEPRVLDRMAADGYRLLLAGHTHGGQLCVPFYGALVTNCGLDRKRAKGLSRWPVPVPVPVAAASAPAATSAPTATSAPADAWLHVSAGLGTSPFTPVRFACPPEATLLTLTAPSDGAGPGTGR